MKSNPTLAHLRVGLDFTRVAFVCTRVALEIISGDRIEIFVGEN